jgi:hypothetical protein
MEPAKMDIDQFTRLYEAQEWLEDNAPAGAICPCCNRYDKVYKRKITKAALNVLMQLHKHSLHNYGDYFHVTEFCNDGYGHDWHKLRFIGLIEPETQINGDGQNAGRYMITSLGKEFCKGRVEIPKHLIIYHNKCIGASLEFADINYFWRSLDYDVEVAVD